MPLLALLLGCSEPAPPAARPLLAGAAPLARCATTLRVAAELRTMRALPDGGILDDGHQCRRDPLCLQGGRRALVLGLEPGRSRVQVEGGTPVEVAVSARDLVARGAVVSTHLDGGVLVVGPGATGVRVLPRPAAREGERAEDVVELDGHLAVEMVKRADCAAAGAARLAWLDPGRTEPLPRGLPFGAGQGVAGWMEPVDGGWSVRVLPEPDAVVLPFLPGESVTALAGPPGVILHGTRKLWQRGPADATWRPVATGQEEWVVMGQRDAWLVRPAGGVDLLRNGMRFPVRPDDDTRDLAGAPLAAGTERERVQLATGPGDEVIAVERLRRADCRAEDRVHLLGLGVAPARTVARGDRVRLHPRHALGAWRWVEGPARYTNVDDAERAATLDLR